MKEKPSASSSERHDYDQALALQLYYDEKKNHHNHPYKKDKKIRNSVQSTFTDAKKDIEKKLSSAFRDCIAMLEKNQLPSHHNIYTIKGLVDNQKKIDSQTRIKLFINAETLVERIRKYFTHYLDECFTVKSILSLEKYFILKSLRYLAEDISYSIVKGDETSKYKNTSLLDFDDHISSVNRRKIFLDGGRKNSSNREIIVIDEERDEGLMLIVETFRSIFMKKFGTTKFQSNKFNSKTLLELFSLLSNYVNSCFGGNSNNIVELSNAFIENFLKKSKSQRIMLGDIRFGVCRHRAILFKYLCDHLFVFGLVNDIRCRLVRGNVNGGNHAWNVVSIIDCEASNPTIQKFFLVDVMLHPGKLYDIASIEAHNYIRQGSDNGIGGLSVRLSPNEKDLYSVVGMLINQFHKFIQTIFRRETFIGKRGNW